MKTEHVWEVSVANGYRFFESENYTLQRVFFENGVVDGGHDKLKFDFSDCKFENIETCFTPLNLELTRYEEKEDQDDIFDFDEIDEIDDEYVEQLFDENGNLIE